MNMDSSTDKVVRNAIMKASGKKPRMHKTSNVENKLYARYDNAKLRFDISVR